MTENSRETSRSPQRRDCILASTSEHNRNKAMAGPDPRGDGVSDDVSVDYGDTDDEQIETINATRGVGVAHKEPITSTFDVVHGPSAGASDAFTPIGHNLSRSPDVSGVAPRTATEMVVEQSFQSAAKAIGSNSPATPGDVSPVRRSPIRSSPGRASLSTRFNSHPNDGSELEGGELAQGEDSTLPSEDHKMADIPAAGTGDGDPQRTQRVVIGARHCVPPCTYDEIDVYADDSQTKYAMRNAPWFEKDVVSVLCQRDDDAAIGSGPGANGVDLLSPYLNARGRLPGGLPRGALRKWWWRRVFCVCDRDLNKDSGAPMHVLRQDFTSLALKGLRRLLTRDLMEEDVSDLFVYRTRGEMDYVESLQGLDAALITNWQDGEYADGRALLFSRPLLSLKFRYESKKCSFLLEQVAEEKALSTEYDLLIPYFTPQATVFNREGRKAFAQPTNFWKSIQLPEGALIELPTVVAHCMSRLRNQHSGWWVVAYTEYAARAAAFILSEVYDSLMLWYAPPALITLIRSLDLTWVLGNDRNVEELEGLLCLISNTDFRLHAPAQRLRFDHGKASQAQCADFIYFDPWRGQVLDHAGYTALRTQGRVQMPAGHPRGFNWEVEVEGWDGRRYIRPEHADVVDEVVPTVEYFGIEHIKNAPGRFFYRGRHGSTDAYAGAYFGVSTVDTALQPGPVPRVEGQGQPAPVPEVGAGVLTDALREEAVRDFLREVGYDVTQLANMREMVMYTRGKSNL